MEKVMISKPGTVPQKLRTPARALQRKVVGKAPAAKRPDHSDPQVTPEMLHAMIAEAAYYHAEKRGFSDGGALDDWLQAETEIEALLKHGGMLQ